MSKPLDELAELIRKRVASAPPAKPKLRLVGRDDLVADQAPGLDPQTRDCMYRRIRDLARMYWLAWLVRQETAQVQGVIECLDDGDLSALLDKMERARECRVEGIGFDEAGLVRALEG